MNKQKIVKLIPLLIMSGIIFSFSLQVADVSNQQSGFIVTMILPLIRTILPFLSIDTITYLVRKTAHFSEYALLGVLGGNASTAWKECKLSYMFLLYGPLNALCDETIQYFVPGRSCQFSDMLLDSCGYFFGFLVFAIISKLTQKRKSS